jgi:hypothetical protein
MLGNAAPRVLPRVLPAGHSPARACPVAGPPAGLLEQRRREPGKHVLALSGYALRRVVVAARLQAPFAARCTASGSCPLHVGSSARPFYDFASARRPREGSCSFAAWTRQSRP